MKGHSTIVEVISRAISRVGMELVSEGISVGPRTVMVEIIGQGGDHRTIIYRLRPVVEVLRSNERDREDEVIKNWRASKV